MVGPFMQGVLLMGIIYWYSKGMLSLINDYYRSEIQRKIQVGEPLNESSDFINVDQIIEHRLGKIKVEQQEKMGEPAAAPPKPPPMLQLKNAGGGVEQLSQSKDGEFSLFVCRREKRLEEFYKIVEHALSICYLNDIMLTAAN